MPEVIDLNLMLTIAGGIVLGGLALLFILYEHRFILQVAVLSIAGVTIWLFIDWLPSFSPVYGVLGYLVIGYMLIAGTVRMYNFYKSGRAKQLWKWLTTYSGVGLARSIIAEPVENRHVGYAKFSTDCFWCDSKILPSEMVLYYGEPPAQVPWRHKTATFHYSCAMTLDLYRDTDSSLTLWGNLKERFEAGEKIKKLLLKNSPELDAPGKEEKMSNPPGLAAVKEDLDEKGNVPMIEMAESVVFTQVLERLAREFAGEEKSGGITKFITQLENSSLPLPEFMAPVLEKIENPFALADIVVALSEEDNHNAVVIEMVKEALNGWVKKTGSDKPIPLTNVMAHLEKMANELDPVRLAKLKVALERALGKKDHPLIAALNAQLGKDKRTL